MKWARIDTVRVGVPETAERVPGCAACYIIKASFAEDGNPYWTLTAVSEDAVTHEIERRMGLRERTKVIETLQRRAEEHLRGSGEPPSIEDTDESASEAEP